MKSNLHLGRLFEAVKTTVEGAHEKVLTLFLDRLEERLDELDVAASKCSYAAHLSSYVQLKVQAHHLKNFIDDNKFSTGDYARLSELQHRIRVFHNRMYSNVCRECQSCRSRRKQWPSVLWRIK